MNYRRSIVAQSQRLLFLTVYVVLSAVAATTATTPSDIRNAALPPVTATELEVSAS